jgi:hypothetical protein
LAFCFSAVRVLLLARREPLVLNKPISNLMPRGF